MNTELKYDHKYNLVNISEKYKYLLEKFSNPIKNDINETEAVVRQEKNNVRRNDPCPCGSGIKYKKCCGK